MQTLRSNWFIVVLSMVIVGVILHHLLQTTSPVNTATKPADSLWIAPSLFSDVETAGTERQLVAYGEALIVHTAQYLGPKGSVSQTTNGMNCQNCHLDGGTRAWGNNYSAVASTYPKFRERSGQVENIYKRVNDCLERSLNGLPLDTASREMQAIATYIKWLGKSVPKGTKPTGAGLEKLPFPDRAASPLIGKKLYEEKCASCHLNTGEGVLAANGNMYQYPPLWGQHSYNDGAGLYRLSNFASYIKNNMPYNQASHLNPALQNIEAWDVAAYVNSMPRPHLNQYADYPNIAKKPFDTPYGPYADAFNEQQHKYGPYKPIVAAGK